MNKLFSKMDKSDYDKGYNKAISDFLDKIEDYGFDETSNKIFDIITKELKK